MRLIAYLLAPPQLEQTPHAVTFACDEPDRIEAL